MAFDKHFRGAGFADDPVCRRVNFGFFRLPISGMPTGVNTCPGWIQGFLLQAQ